MKRNTHGTLLASILAGLTLMWIGVNAQAVPSFARQTGMPCSGCHTKYPELNQFGRTFKLNGYTLAGISQIQKDGGSMSAGLKINQIPALSAMVQISATKMSKTDPTMQNDSVAFPQEASLFYAGEISESVGTFLQITYAQDSGTMEWDNSDVRYVGKLGNMLWGLTLNNNPTVQDPWNTTPAWGFPFAESGAANTPAASTLIDGNLAQDVGGLGTYVLLDGTIYGEISLYRSAHQGEAAPTIGSTNTIKGMAPYWRLAWQHNFGDNYLMLGTYGIKANLYPGDGTSLGLTGPTDDYTDTAVDAQYERQLDGNMLTVRGTYINEEKNLDATLSTGGASNKSDSLKTLKINGTYHLGTEYAVSLAHFRTTGDTDALLYADSANGSPDSTGEIVQATFLPAENIQLTAQYTLYNKFDGATKNYDGSGRKASDNDTLYLMAWLTW